MALAAAEQLEKTAGPKPALVAFRKLALDLVAFEARGRATLGALRCATKLDDIEALDGLTLWWRAITEGDFTTDVAEIAIELARRGLVAQARELARAEVDRYRTARALYLFARCLERGQDRSGAAATYAEAATRAAKEGHRDIGAMARLRRVVLLSAAAETLPLALSEANDVPMDGLDDSAKLALCIVLLRAPSRFVRSSALGSLEELATPLRPRATDAIRMAARHADTAGDGLTALEAERVAGVLRHWPNDRQRGAASACLAAVQKITSASDAARDDAIVAAAAADARTSSHLTRARAALAGAARGPSAMVADAPASYRVAALAVDAVVAMRDGNERDAARALAAAVAGAAHVRPTPAPVWTAAHQALLFASPLVASEGARLAHALLEAEGDAGAPPRGYLAFATALRTARRHDLSLLALRAACARREKNATVALVDALTGEAWAAATRAADLRRQQKPSSDVREERRRALVLLREAKALSARGA